MNPVTVTVEEDLDLDMTRVAKVPLQVDPFVTEDRTGGSGRALVGGREVAMTSHDLHAFATSARHGLDDDRVADLRRQRRGMLKGGYRFDAARQQRHAGVLHEPPRG